MNERPNVLRLNCGKIDLEGGVISLELNESIGLESGDETISVMCVRSFFFNLRFLPVYTMYSSQNSALN